VIAEAVREYRRLKERADVAVGRLSDQQFFRALDPESNSVALLLKHVGGNLRSRWTDFLHADGEKADRDRDAEFELGEGDTRLAVLGRWEEGWRALFAALEALRPADLERAVRIRGEQVGAVDALFRNLAHTAQHVGQILLLAKHLVGPGWESLSIPRRTKPAP
jgi:hypothetical protein